MATNGNSKHGKIDVPFELFLELNAKFETARRTKHKDEGLKGNPSHPDFVVGVTSLSAKDLNDAIQHNEPSDIVERQRALYEAVIV